VLIHALEPAADGREAMATAPPLQNSLVDGRELGAARGGPLALDSGLDKAAGERSDEREAVQSLIENVPGAAEPDRRHRAEHRDLAAHGW